MRLQVDIDAMHHEIDSTDPELLGKWVVEIFGRAVAGGISASTRIMVRAQPSWIPDDSPAGGRPDWIADSRVMGHAYQVSSPHDLVAVLAQQIADAEAMASGSGDN